MNRTFWENLWARLGPAQEETYFAAQNKAILSKLLEKIVAARNSAITGPLTREDDGGARPFGPYCELKAKA